MLINTGPRGRRPQGRLVELELESGKKKRVRLRKGIPKKCSTPRRICIKCLSTAIHKNSRFYDSKVCEACSETDWFFPTP